MPETPRPPSPELFFETANAYQRTAALQAAIELELFTAIGEGRTTAPDIAARCGTDARATRILCDFLTIIGFLTKEDDNYALTNDSAIFLDRRSPAYLGGATEFLLSEPLADNFKRLADAVRRGGTASEEGGTVSAENPVWVKFARAMAPMAAMPAPLIAHFVDAEASRPLRILDIAAGHGLYGIAFARRNPQATVVALDWPGVLEVAKENARAAGVADRYETIEGSAFDAPFGEGYDLVLLTNFLHHFDPPTCEGLLRKVHDALAPGGRAVTLEFVPNDDRVTPPIPAAFSLTMLASTPAGDAYTFPELERMLANAGFTRSEIHHLPPTIQPVIISEK
jgi:2-polyprenyl-3-methyl-5-hydroxy-6-metoxy-1,4-benzoquinol methylase